MDWPQLAERFGLPATMFFGVLYLLSKKIWTPGWYSTELEARLARSEEREQETRTTQAKLAEANADLIATLKEQARWQGSGHGGAHGT
jgi:hypothetical protein